MWKLEYYQIRDYRYDRIKSVFKQFQSYQYVSGFSSKCLFFPLRLFTTWNIQKVAFPCVSTLTVSVSPLIVLKSKLIWLAVAFLAMAPSFWCSLPGEIKKLSSLICKANVKLFCLAEAEIFVSGYFEGLKIMTVFIVLNFWSVSIWPALFVSHFDDSQSEGKVG